ncbi:hypothetical protein IQ268_10375 [Oculatella sp. LEGE 06141]|nr:hypothetical protein [Oculatella sp. LEGE 06141]MBE9178967.1 hypothetical protein [Oculatella sp. LEGE 06141]
MQKTQYGLVKAATPGQIYALVRSQSLLKRADGAVGRSTQFNGRPVCSDY